MGFSQDWDFVKECCNAGQLITVVVDGCKITGTFEGMSKNKLVRLRVTPKDPRELKTQVTFEISRVSAYGLGEW